MTHKPPSIDQLNAMAKATNDAVRQEAIERGELLPVWKDGRVVLVWPAAPGRKHAVSIGLLVRALVERGVKVSTSDIEAVAAYVPVGDVELVLTSDNLSVAEWLKVASHAGFNRPVFPGTVNYADAHSLHGSVVPSGAYLNLSGPLVLGDANQIGWNIDPAVKAWTTNSLKLAANEDPTPPAPAKVRA
jgi:hypothetical protein